MPHPPAIHRSGQSTVKHVDALSFRKLRSPGLSLLELLATLTILSVLVVVLIPNLRRGTADAKSRSCEVNRSVIEIQTGLWYRNHGRYPSTSLSSIRHDQNYFPDGLPVCPVDGEPYVIDSNTGMVEGHRH